MLCRLDDERGQGTVEAALVIPVLFLLLLVLLQPGIVLYDYIVMRGAAAEACRLVAVSEGAEGIAGCQDFIRNRLSAIPQHDLFHVHGGGCSWLIEVRGNEQSASAIVEIRNLIEPLPLFGGALGLLGAVDADGHLAIQVEEWAPNQPGWVASSVSGGPASWVAEW